MTKGPTTLGVIVGNRGFFPSHLCSTGRKEVLEAIAQEGFGVGGARPRVDDARRGREPGRRAGLRRPLPRAPRRDRRRARHAAELRRRARRREHASLGRARRARSHPCLQRRWRADDDRASPRQLLRQDVGLQQSAPVRHPLLADARCTRSSRTPDLPRRPAPLRRDLPGRPRAARTRVSARSARDPRRSTRCATARSCSSASGISVETLDLSEVLGCDRAVSTDGDPRVKDKLDAIGAYTNPGDSRRQPR